MDAPCSLTFCLVAMTDERRWNERLRVATVTAFCRLELLQPDRATASSLHVVQLENAIQRCALLR